MNTVIKFSKIFFDFPDVEQRNIQPEWPGGGAPQLTDAIWILAAACWMKDSIQRPTVNTVRTTFFSYIPATAMSTRYPIPVAPPHIINFTLYGNLPLFLMEVVCSTSNTTVTGLSAEINYGLM
jgi:hypothetical protein